VQQLQPPVILVRVDDELVVDGDDLRRTVLSNGMHVDLGAAEIELQHRRHAFDPLDHAGRHSCKKQFSRVERVQPPIDVRIKDDLRILAASQTAVRVQPLDCCRTVLKS